MLVSPYVTIHTYSYASYSIAITIKRACMVYIEDNNKELGLSILFIVFPLPLSFSCSPYYQGRWGDIGLLILLKLLVNLD